MRETTEFGMSARHYGEGLRQIAYLHGLGEAGGVFAPLVAELGTDEYTHTVVDLPGYGRSAWPESPLSLTALAQSLESWIASFSSPPVLVGHSMGGVIATLIAERAPHTLRALVNIEGNVCLDDCTFSGPIAAQDVATYLADGHSEAAHRIYEMSRDSAPERFYYAAFRFADPASTHRHATDLVEISAVEFMAATLANLRLPAVFIAGVPDGLSARSLDLLHAAGVQTVAVEPAGHWTYWDQPAVCARVIAGLF